MLAVLLRVFAAKVPILRNPVEVLVSVLICAWIIVINLTIIKPYKFSFFTLVF